jgi:long-chain acyl-CoA synthetase
VNDNLIGWAQSLGFIAESLTELSRKREVRNAMLKSLETLGNQHGLKKFEMIRGCLLETSPFTCENGLLTPTYKLRV